MLGHIEVESANRHGCVQAERVLDKPGDRRDVPGYFFKFLSQTGVNGQPFGGFAEMLVSCPQECGRIDED